MISLAEIIKEISPDAVFLEQDDSDLYETYQVSFFISFITHSLSLNQVPSKKFVFSQAFETLEHFKQKGDIADFSIYHTTLENVFLEFSRYQRDSNVKRKRDMPPRKSSLQDKMEWEKAKNSRGSSVISLSEMMNQSKNSRKRP